jgi:hypothetical protein
MKGPPEFEHVSLGTGEGIGVGEEGDFHGGGNSSR